MDSISRNDAIKRTGELMLQGWKLLATCCPICHTALMSSKDGQMRCPGCDLPVVVQGADASPPQVTESNEEEIGDEELAEFEADLPSSLEELRREYEEKNKRSNKTSELMGEKLLLGWAMLNEECPCMDCRGTPLMRLNKSDPMLCVSCNKKYIKNEYGKLVNQEASDIALTKSIPAATTQKILPNYLDEAPILSFDSFSRKNDPSQKISQKMIQGWALLDKCCTLTNCPGNIPLLRDKNGKLYCVECGYVENDLQPIVQGKPSASSIVLDDDDDEEETRKVFEKFDVIANKIIEDSASINVRESIIKPRTTKYHSTNDDRIVEIAINSVNQKLAYAVSLMENETNLEKLTQTASLVARLAEALKELKHVV